MNVDWAATGAMLQGEGTLLGAGAVLIAAFVGANTFRSWRKQKVEERRMQQAEHILASAYKARRALKQVRHWLMSGYELGAAQETLKDNEQWQMLVAMT
jgi:hypothetical protein